MEIKIRRLRADISQSDLAKQIGVSQSHLCNVENGRLSPSLRLLLSLRKLLGCTIDELLIGTDTESKGNRCDTGFRAYAPKWCLQQQRNRHDRSAF